MKKKALKFLYVLSVLLIVLFVLQLILMNNASDADFVNIFQTIILTFILSISTGIICILIIGTLLFLLFSFIYKKTKQFVLKKRGKKENPPVADGQGHITKKSVVKTIIKILFALIVFCFFISIVFNFIMSLAASLFESTDFPDTFTALLGFIFIYGGAFLIIFSVLMLFLFVILSIAVFKIVKKIIKYYLNKKRSEEIQEQPEPSALPCGKGEDGEKQ
ncbi:MAG: hypothetical protein E7473_01565 [Ruminococcaceae bacterium]|nr:hypothetical protein [Oscillospiraceae bacterium]